MRLILGVAMMALAATLWTPEADARGGNYRGPGGAIPPMMREPSDPTPPPPPPPMGMPVAVPVPAPSGVPVPVPPVPTTPPPPPVPVSRPSGGLARQSLSFASWLFWYHYNQEIIEPRSKASLKFARDRAMIEKEVLPALNWALDPNNAGAYQIRSAACVALGKVATEPGDVEALRTVLGATKQLWVAESAILGLGLLRRSDAERQFAPDLLDAVRSDLLTAMSDTTRQARQRGLAAVSLGLLGDQPTRSEVMAKATAVRLGKFLAYPHKHPDLQIAALVGLSLQPPEALSDDQRDAVRRIYTKSLVAKGQRRPFLRAHAATALGRMGTEKDAALLLSALKRPPPADPNLLRSSLLALGTLGTRLDGEDRARIVAGIRQFLEPPKDPEKPGPKRDPPTDDTQKGFALMSLARIAAVEVEPGKEVAAWAGEVGEFLRTKARTKNHSEASYAALGLGLMGKAMRRSPAGDHKAWLEETARILRAGVADRKSDKYTRGAYATALGLMDDEKGRAALKELLTDQRQDPGLRAASARALALRGRAESETIEQMLGAMRERRSEVMRSSCAAALGMLAAGRARGPLREEIRNARSYSVKGTAARAAVGLGSADMVADLVAILHDAGAPWTTRSIACAGLGLAGDPEPIPSLSRVVSHTNWRTSTDLLNEIASIL